MSPFPIPLSRRALRRGGAIAVGASLLVLGGGPARATSNPGGEHQVTLCHATDSDANPYVTITVDVASVRFAGHAGHTGPVWSPDHAKHAKWGDIIPAFDFGGGLSYAGMNLADGSGILEDGCNIYVEH
jgi:hypothetical protein